MTTKLRITLTDFTPYTRHTLYFPCPQQLESNLANRQSYHHPKANLRVHLQHDLQIPSPTHHEIHNSPVGSKSDKVQNGESC